MTPIGQRRDTRQSERTNTLLAATAMVGATAWPIKIRNISRFGLMVESAVKAQVGSSVSISRGSLRAAGEIVWSLDKTFGVKFFNSIDTAEWAPRRDAALAPNITHKRQPRSDLSNETLSSRCRQELGFISRTLDGLADSLSRDPVLRIRYASEIQQLCINSEMVQQIACVYGDDDIASAVDRFVTGPMRSRLLCTGGVREGDFSA